ncbi:MAG: DUF6686 family protein, partial [Bacteroidota bacterium]
QTTNGMLFRCDLCKMYHLSFGQFYLELTKDELKHFKTFLHQIDPEHWYENYQRCALKRKIPIPTLQCNLFITLHHTELEELKHLLAFDTYKGESMVAAMDIDYTIMLN